MTRSPFTKLKIWERGIELVDIIYDATERFPQEELYGLRSQLEDEWRAPCFQLLDTWVSNKKLPPEQRWKRLKKVRTHWWNPADL